MWKTSVTCTTICSQIDRGIPFSVYPSSAPHPGRYNVTTSVVGLENGQTRKHLTKYGEPQRYSRERKRRRVTLTTSQTYLNLQRLNPLAFAPSKTALSLSLVFVVVFLLVSFFFLMILMENLQCKYVLQCYYGVTIVCACLCIV